MDGLERRGLAERRPSPSDRRARIIAITDEGERVAQAGAQIIAGVYADVLSSLAPAEREGFVSGLVRLAGERLSAPVACERPPRRRAL